MKNNDPRIFTDFCILAKAVVSCPRVAKSLYKEYYKNNKKLRKITKLIISASQTKNFPNNIENIFKKGMNQAETIAYRTIKCALNGIVK